MVTKLQMFCLLTYVQNFLLALLLVESTNQVSFKSVHSTLYL